MMSTVAARVIRIVCNKISTMQIGRQHKWYIHNPSNHHYSLWSQLSHNSKRQQYKHCLQRWTGSTTLLLNVLGHSNMHQPNKSTVLSILLLDT